MTDGPTDTPAAESEPVPSEPVPSEPVPSEPVLPTLPMLMPAGVLPVLPPVTPAEVSVPTPFDATVASPVVADVAPLVSVDAPPVEAESTPASMHAPASRRRWLILGVALAVTAIIVAGVVAFGADSGSRSPANARQASEALRGLIADAEFTDSTMSDIACPIDLTAAFRRAPEGAPVADLIGQGEFSAVLRPEGSQVALVECSYEGTGTSADDTEGDDGDGRLAGVSLGNVELDTDFIAAMRSYLPQHRLTFADPADHRGGALYAYCGEPTAAAARQGFDAFCEVDYVRHDIGLVVGVFAAPGELDEQGLTDWLAGNLDEIVAELAELAELAEGAEGEDG